MESVMHPYDWGDQLPVLNGHRVVLRPLALTDAPAIFEIFGDPRVMRYWLSGPLEDLNAARASISDIHECFRRRTHFQWGVARLEDDHIIGTGTLFNLETEHRRVEVGYALAHSFWGQGYATETVAMLLEFAFSTLGLHRVEADVDPRNKRSVRVLERQGFEREGYFRERYRVRGEIQDGVFLGLLRHEWKREAIRSAL